VALAVLGVVLVLVSAGVKPRAPTVRFSPTPKLLFHLACRSFALSEEGVNTTIRHEIDWDVNNVTDTAEEEAEEASPLLLLLLLVPPLLLLLALLTLVPASRLKPKQRSMAISAAPVFPLPGGAQRRAFCLVS
jgi:hypothetical protein